MDDVIASAYLKWLQADWEYRCPVCLEPLEAFTTHTSLCDECGLVEAEKAIPWAVVETP